MSAYIDSDDLDDEWGASNVTKWSDLNDAGSRDTARVTACIAYAEGVVEDRFRDGRYTVPLVFNSTGSQAVFKRIVARIAGGWLYGARGVEDDVTEVNKVQAAVKEAHAEIDAYLSGMRRLNASLGQGTARVPFVVK